MTFETAIHQWREGERRLDGAPPQSARRSSASPPRIQAELRRRLGGAFTVDELADLYDQGTGWCLDSPSPSRPARRRRGTRASTADAAFARYVREAVDFAGGRRIRALAVPAPP